LLLPRSGSLWTRRNQYRAAPRCYRHLREISKQHHYAVIKLISRDAVRRHARGLGAAIGKTLVLDRIEDLSLAYDLAIYTAPRSRAVDRYARSARFEPGSGEHSCLRPCARAFSVVSVQRRHGGAGLIVNDLLRDIDLWLVDEGLEMSLSAGTAFAKRYFAPDRFVMTSGVGIPFDDDLLENGRDRAQSELMEITAIASQHFHARGLRRSGKLANRRRRSRARRQFAQQ
jgi:hypothetical protein